jgi:mono/diheme cytochrome c family protein
VISWRPLRTVVVTIASASALATAQYVRAGDRAAARGAEVFAKYCVLCHGASGVGNGRAASLQKVPPADLTSSTRPRSYKLQIVTRGGAEMGRSESMPAWREVLSEVEIQDVVSYIEMLSRS